MHTARDLARIRAAWPLLDAMLDTRHGTQWPPAGRMSDYLAALEATATDEAVVGRGERDGSGTGETPAPIRLDIVDTARTIETAMLTVADQVAIHQPAELPASERWHYNASWRHGVPWACIWLTGALHWLPAAHAHLVANVAAEAVERLERALDLQRREQPLDEPCPHCRGRLVVEGGDGEPPSVNCRQCGRTWTADSQAAA